MMEHKIEQLKIFGRECLRVLRITRKPDAQEFKTTVKITSLGMLAIGLLGFIILVFKELLF